MRDRHRFIVIGLFVLAVACGGGDDTGVSSTAASSPSTTGATTLADTTTSSSPPPEASTTTAQVVASGGIGDGCAHVIDGSVTELDDGEFRVDATVSSNDTGWDKYADAWEVRTTDGTVLGVRELAHPHETEQPFTRSLSPVEIPADIDQVVLVARDSVEGFCGESFTASIER